MKNEQIIEILKGMNSVLLGQGEISKFLLTAMISDGHVLLEGVPGVGKTTLANALAKSIEGKFARIQFTPDTMPGDITGVSVYNFEKHMFEYVEGVLMNHIILADEINRTSPKTQAALLEAMEEGYVTVDGIRHKLPDPFMVIATQNPVMQRGTYYLPESQLDRFMMKLTVGYPNAEEEMQLVRNMLEDVTLKKIEGVISCEGLNSIKELSRKVIVKENLIAYATECIRSTRTCDKVLLGASPRALLTWIKASKAYAFIEGRDYVIPDDLKKLAHVVLAHRLVMVQNERENEEALEVISTILRKVKVPIGK